MSSARAIVKEARPIRLLKSNMPYDEDKGWIFLSYLERFQPELSQEFEGGSAFALSPSYYSDRDESKAWVIRLTGREFTKLLSSLMKGSGLTYPFESDSVNWTFLRSMEGAMAEICAEIINCVNTDTDTQNALDSRTISIVNNSQEALLEKILQIFNLQVNPPEGGDCNDKLFACIKQTLQYMDQKNLDWLESVEASATNNIAELANVISSITILDELSVDAVTEFITWVSDNLLDAYPSVSTVTLLDEVACDIFCLVKDTCVVTLLDIHNYFLARVVAELPTLDITSFVEFSIDIVALVIGSPSRLVFDVMMLSCTTTALTIDALLGTILKGNGGASDLYTRMKAFSNDSDNDWTILCEDCGTVAKTITVYGRAYQINGGAAVVVNSSVDGFYTVDCNIGDEITLTCNGSAVAVGNCSTSTTQTVTITYVSIASGETANFRQNGTCTILTTFTVGDNLTDGQAEIYGLSAMSFTVEA
jgi:hypothetical protein